MNRLPRFYVYLLLCREDGTVYLGYSGNLRQRFKAHNTPGRTRYTSGRRWHLLAVRCFLDRYSAELYEKQLKRSKYDKRNWIKRIGRLRTLCDRHDIQSRHMR